MNVGRPFDDAGHDRPRRLRRIVEASVALLIVALGIGPAAIAPIDKGWIATAKRTEVDARLIVIASTPPTAVSVTATAIAIATSAIAASTASAAPTSGKVPATTAATDVAAAAAAEMAASASAVTAPATTAMASATASSAVTTAATGSSESGLSGDGCRQRRANADAGQDYAPATRGRAHAALCE